MIFTTGHAVSWRHPVALLCTALQAGRSRVRFSLVTLEFFN